LPETATAPARPLSPATISLPPSPDAPPVALVRDRQPVDFALHGGAPIVPFSLAGPPPQPPLESRANAGIMPSPAEAERRAFDARAAVVRDAFSRPGYVPPAEIADVAKSAGIGVVNGVIGLAGMLPAASKGLHDVLDPWIDRGFDALSGSSMPAAVSPPNINAMFSPPGIRRAIESVTGPFYHPTSRAGHWAETVGELAPAVLGGGARGILSGLRGEDGLAAAGEGLLNLGRNLWWHAVVPGAAIEASRETLPDSSAPWWLQKGYTVGRAVAPLVGGALPGGISALRSFTAR
jgi:hypothetical protein